MGAAGGRGAHGRTRRAAHFAFSKNVLAFETCSRPMYVVVDRPFPLPTHLPSKPVPLPRPHLPSHHPILYIPLSQPPRCALLSPFPPPLVLAPVPFSRALGPPPFPVPFSRAFGPVPFPSLSSRPLPIHLCREMRLLLISAVSSLCGVSRLSLSRPAPHLSLSLSRVSFLPLPLSPLSLSLSRASRVSCFRPVSPRISPSPSSLPLPLSRLASLAFALSLQRY